MSMIHLHETTTATPEQYIAGLSDFGPGRSELFGNSADDYLKVHDQGPTEADVTEGKNLKGRFLGLVLGSVGKSRLEKAFVDSIKAIEARNGDGGTDRP
jgi:hypothetical protein